MRRVAVACRVEAGWLFQAIPGLPVSRQTRAGLIKRQPNVGFLKPPWRQFSFVVIPGCLSPGKPGSAIKKDSPWPAFLSRLGVVFPPVVIPRLPVSRQTRAGLMKKATQRRLQKAALGAVLFAVIPGLHIPRQTRAGHLKKGSPRPAFLSRLGVVFFVVIPRLPASRQTRAGLMKNTTQRRL